MKASARKEMRSLEAAKGVFYVIDRHRQLLPKIDLILKDNDVTGEARVYLLALKFLTEKLVHDFADVVTQSLAMTQPSPRRPIRKGSKT